MIKSSIHFLIISLNKALNIFRDHFLFTTITSKNKQKDKVPLDVLLNSITKITSPSDDDTP